MINLIQSTPNLIKKSYGKYAKHTGVLIAPHSMRDLSDNTLVWAMDNACFVDYNPKKIVGMMRRYRGTKGCLFMTAPDVVSNHEESLLLFRMWLGTIQNYGYPVAFVIQNGATIENIPWGSIQAIFIGGDDKFKLSDEVIIIMKEAKRRGLWVHVGRINSKKRLWHFIKHFTEELGHLIDSFDGGCYARFRDTYVSHLELYANDYIHPNYTRKLL